MFVVLRLIFVGHMLETIPILGPSTDTDSQVNPQKTVNMYVKIESPGAISPISLRRTPGLPLIASAGTGGVGRSNGTRWKGKEYFVIGASLVSIDDNDVVATVGTLLTNSGRCEITRGRSYVMVVDGTYGYAWNGTTFTQNIQSGDADFPNNPTHCRYIDGFFIVNEAGTDNFYRSDLEDPTGQDPLIFEVASASPDNILALGVFDRDIFTGGEDSTQRYYNSGGAGFNFSPYPNTIQMGLVAPYSLYDWSGGVTGLFQSRTGGLGVYTLTGGQAIPESTDDDNEEMQGFSTKLDAFGTFYTLNNLNFYALTFPSANVTKVFQLGRKLSHHQASYDSTLPSGTIGRWRVSGLGYTGKRILAVDYANDNIYTLDTNTYTENSNPLICERFSQIIHNKGLPISCSRYEVHAKRGVGILSGQGSNPKLQLAVSYNGGETYSVHRSKSIGGQGQYRRRSVWKHLSGDVEQLNTWLRYSEPTDFAIFGGTADVTF